MIVEMSASATAEDVARVVRGAEAANLTPTVVQWPERRFVITLSGGDSALGTLPGVCRAVDSAGPHHLAGREFHGSTSVVEVGGWAIGGNAFTVIAGPCAVESREQLAAVVPEVATAGAVLIRGGAFKPRTSPYAFDGLGVDGLRLLAEQRTLTGRPIVTEVLRPDDVDLVAEHADMLQIGTRNMQNFPLLREVGRCGRPVLLKRGMSATIQEWLLAAEHILAAGNPDVLLCERGIRTFEAASRFTLDLTAVPVVRQLSHLPVIVDPSHAAGLAYAVPPLALAAAAVGADGVMLDVHASPETARCDGSQALTPTEFKQVMTDLERLLAALPVTLT